MVIRLKSARDGGTEGRPIWTKVIINNGDGILHALTSVLIVNKRNLLLLSFKIYVCRMYVFNIPLYYT